MKLNARKRHAIRLLVKRWVVITLVALLMVLVVFWFDKFQLTRVSKPLFDLAMLNREISYYKECESKYVGYIDTTQFSEKIRELTKERQEKFYNSDDELVAYISTRHSLVKMFFLAMSVILVLVLTVGSVAIIFIWYANAVGRFRISWRHSNRRMRPGNYSVYK